MYTFEKALLIAIPGFVLLMLAEYVYGLLRGRNTYSNLADAISSISSGLTFVLGRTVGLGLLIFSYGWFSEFAEGQGFPSSANPPLWMWLLTFVWKDFTGYWQHRWAHANSFLWAMHMIHHSSEEFNLPVALRQNAFIWLGYQGLMLAPLALFGVPVEVVAVVVPIHFFLQFWYHTQHINNLGPFEYVIVTPSQHRVHHAINGPYIDKNFGQVFCLWDRLFGTFQPELKAEPVVYGITTPVRNYNPVLIELQYTGRLLRDALRTKRLRDKLAVFFSRTGWRPDDVSQRYPLHKIDNPSNFDKFAPATPQWVVLWGWLQLTLSVLLAVHLFAIIQELAFLDRLAYVAVAMSGVYAANCQLQNQGSIVAELIRVAIFGAVVVVSGSWFGATSTLWLTPMLAGLFTLSLLLALRRAFSLPNQVVIA